MARVAFQPRLKMCVQLITKPNELKQERPQHSPQMARARTQTKRQCVFALSPGRSTNAALGRPRRGTSIHIAVGLFAY